jgi:hypothetical protein
MQCTAKLAVHKLEVVLPTGASEHYHLDEPLCQIALRRHLFKKKLHFCAQAKCAAAAVAAASYLRTLHER